MAVQSKGRQLNIADGIREFAIASPRSIAIIDGDRRITYAELDERSNRVANMLLSSGLLPGSHVAFHSGNRLEYCEVAAGIAKAGMVMVPLNPRSARPELEFILDHSDARALILDAALGETGAQAAANVGIDKVWSIDGGDAGPDYESVLAAAGTVDPGIRVDETEPFAIAYTSGTTGDPKGVMISHRSRTLTFFAAGIEWGIGPGRNTVAVAPMYHGAGFAFAYAAVALGGTLSMLRSFDPEMVLAMVERDRISSMFLVPVHATMIRNLGEDIIQRYDLSTLECMYFNAAPFPQALKEWTVNMFPQAGVHEVYGSTEAGVVTDLRPEFVADKPGSVGPAWFMTEIRVVNEEGEPVKPGEPGELFSRSPYLMNGYYKNPDATEAVTTPDGFVTAGDVAILDEDRFVYIVDRVKDMIISGGVNIYPREIEEVLARHPKVRDVAVVGVPDELWGEKVVAVVVGDASPEELEQLTRQNLAGYKVPKEFVKVAELPRNAAGKILKREMKQQLSEPHS
jgi:acyl-CoA synthetase (AMP-forming)/AMP-acid ligase II